MVMNIWLVDLFLEMRYKNREKNRQVVQKYLKLEELHSQIFIALFAEFEKLNY